MSTTMSRDWTVVLTDMQLDEVEKLIPGAADRARPLPDSGPFSTYRVPLSGEESNLVLDHLGEEPIRTGAWT